MSKKIFYIDSMNRGGAQRVMSNLVNYYAKLYERIILINDFRAKETDYTYDVDASIERYYLNDNNWGNPLMKNIKRIQGIRKIVRQEKPDFILSFLGRPNLRMLVATIGLPVKKYVSVRNDPNREYGSKFLNKVISRTLFRLADGCIFQTEEAQAYFPKSVRRRSKVILNPVADRFYNAERKTKTKHIVTFGRLEPQKNHKLLINAFAQIKDKIPQDNLFIFGEGVLRGELSELIVRLNLQERVFLPGNVLNVEEILQEAKLFVLSSDYEGLPNALMEAMAVGVPCIATDCPCGGPRQLLTHGQGVLVHCGDVNGLAHNMLEMLCNDGALIDYGKSAKNSAEQFRSTKIFNLWAEMLHGEI